MLAAATDYSWIDNDGTPLWIPHRGVLSLAFSNPEAVQSSKLTAIPAIPERVESSAKVPRNSCQKKIPRIL
jgi:hypothetical protein